MKKNILHSILIIFLYIPTIVAQQKNDYKIYPLNNSWHFRENGTSTWFPAEVPGSIHQDLLRLGKLPDPFYRTNEKEIQWVEQKDWEYATEFSLSEEEYRYYPHAKLLFDGLDTYATVFLNGALVLQTENMFLRYQVEIKELLKPGINRLHILFRSPILQTLSQWESNGFNYPADNDHHEKHTSVFTRKAPYHYGWDWGIRMVGVGVWRPVFLQLYKGISIDNQNINQKSISKDLVSVQHTLSVQNLTEKPQKVTINYCITLEDKIVYSDFKNRELDPGISTIDTDITIPNPQLWMPNGWGAQPLYKFKTELLSSTGQILDQESKKTGFRTIEFVNSEDKQGRSFYFKVNGNPIFAKGANYIPGDILLGRVTYRDYEQLFEDITAANMNMIRIWGGGIYEDDYFYELADRYGILIWQDFMFACTSYPQDTHFLKNVRAEAKDNILRLRHHPSIALWCGNNEILEAITYWGWQNKYPENVYQGFQEGYTLIFEELLPELVSHYGNDVSYIHGSPMIANWGDPESLKKGDSHYWGIWYGEQPFEFFDNRLGRFMSEYGFQSFPEMKVIRTFAKPEDYSLSSDVMKAHQKSSTGNSIIRKYMERYYHVPDKFEDFIYIGQVMQARGMRHGMEAHRRNRPFCMGSLYWQLNDSWPVGSWSSIDYYKNWKALHYHTREAFAPLMINAIEENKQLRIYLISDLLSEQNNLNLSFRLMDFNGKEYYKLTQKVHLPANESVCVWKGPIEKIIPQNKRKEHLIELTLKNSKGQLINRQLYYFEHPKELNLPQTKIKQKVKFYEGKCEIELKSSHLAKDVFIDVPLQGVRYSDNYFDMLPGEEKKITISSAEFKKNKQVPISIKHLRETY